MDLFEDDSNDPPVVKGVRVEDEYQLSLGLIGTLSPYGETASMAYLLNFFL